MKNVLKALLIVTAFNVTLYSQVKIGVINSQDVLANSQKGLQLQQRLESMQKRKQAELETMQEEIKKLEKDLLSPALNQETRQNKSIELDSKRKTLKRSYEDAQKEFQIESQKRLMELEKELMPIINQYSEDNGFTIVYDYSRAGIIYYDNTIDITENIIQIYDAR